MIANLNKTTSEKNASHSHRRDYSKEANVSIFAQAERIQITKALQHWAEGAPKDELCSSLPAETDTSLHPKYIWRSSKILPMGKPFSGF